VKTGVGHALSDSSRQLTVSHDSSNSAWGNLPALASLSGNGAPARQDCRDKSARQKCKGTFSTRQECNLTICLVLVYPLRNLYLERST